MNVFEADILLEIISHGFTRQRDLASATGHSLGSVNRALKSLLEQEMLAPQIAPTRKALGLCAARSPRNAIILAAGPGMRIAPINVLGPKALLEVNGEPLVERTIKQLHEAGIFDIAIVVGFMKERFDYLIDAYGVELIVNRDYIDKGSLWSLSLAAPRIANTYIVPCDIWYARNPFRSRELYSWYMVADTLDTRSEVRVTRSRELRYVQNGAPGNMQIGLAYINDELAPALRERIAALAQDPSCSDSFWEEALRGPDKMLAHARVWDARSAIEVNSYEQLHMLDGDEHAPGHGVIAEVAAALGVTAADIHDIETLKQGITNSSFSFTAHGTRYVVRIPARSGGSEDLWQREGAAIEAISGLGLCEEPVFFNRDNGHKITRYAEGSHTCDPTDEGDLRACIALLRALHDRHLVTAHAFDPFDAIERYERGWNGSASIFKDYVTVKRLVMALRGFVESHARAPRLAHLDPVPENFLIGMDGSGVPIVQLIDWEHAAMCDPLVDLALFCIHAAHDIAQADRIIHMYCAHEGGCDDATRATVYCYIAICGLLWSNWCELMWHRGIEFGEYSLRLYRYAKEYCVHADRLIASLEKD